MKVKETALERVARRDREARLRVAREEAEQAASIALRVERVLVAEQVDKNKRLRRTPQSGNFVKKQKRLIRERLVERNLPGRMSCCGAPEDGSEPSANYSRRHENRTDGISKHTCRAARQCYQRYRNKQAGGVVRTNDGREEIGGEGRTDCCGAPLAGDEPAYKYYARHLKGSYGVSGRACLPARRCRRLLHQTRIS